MKEVINSFITSFLDSLYKF